jgi:2-methylcitrate dehydratase PrpD
MMTIREESQVERTDKQSPLESLIDNVLGTRFEDLKPATVEAAKHRVIDVVGCAIGGAHAPGNRELTTLIRAQGGAQEATIMVHGGRVPVQNAAMINCILARSNDFETVDTLVDGRFLPSHISGTTVMTALTAGEARRTNGKELIAALVVGDDLAGRVLAAARTDGWDGTGTVNGFGATAIAGRLWGLDRLQLRDAFGIVLNQLGGSFQSTQDTAAAFKLQQGTSARNAIFSVQLSQAGWTGPTDALLSPSGYFALYAQGGSDPDILTKELGKTFYGEVTFKPYPCCRITHPAISCMLALIRNYDLRIERVERITIYASRRALDSMCGQPFGNARFLHAHALYSLYYTVATALLKHDVTLADFTAEAMDNPGIRKLISRIRLAELPGADFMSGSVAVELDDGKMLRESTAAPKGHPLLNPMSKQEILEKFWANIRFSRSVSDPNAERILKALDHLEEVDNVAEIVGWMN